MQYDVKAERVSGTGTVVAYRTRVKGYSIAHTASAGSITLRDGGGSGATRLIIDTPAVAGSMHLEIPGEGILFETDVHATLTNVTGLTIYYG